jgi:predicted alpha-1,2-mannosidase
MIHRLLLLLVLGISILGARAQAPPNTTIWQVGTADRSGAEFALAPAGFRQFVGRDFGYEDKLYVVGFSQPKRDFPYVLPGPADTWGGTWNTAGWRINQVALGFALAAEPAAGGYHFQVRLADYAKKFLPLLKVSINDQDVKVQLTAPSHDLRRQPRPTLHELPVDTASLVGNLASATPYVLDVPINKGVLRRGGNKVVITVLEGSWVLFDQVRLTGPRGAAVAPPGPALVQNVQPAPYELAAQGRRSQPLLVGVHHLSGRPTLQVQLDGRPIFSEAVEQGDYEFEAPMPAVTTARTSRYQVLLEGHVVQAGSVRRAAQPLQTPADYVDTRLGTAHSRWMIAPGPWMPFSMVKLSPDNQNSGWQAGYQPSYESVGTFSHIHEWTMAGLGVFATNGPLKTTIGDELQPGSGYRSRINKKTEAAPIGYYKVQLADYDIRAELTATTRGGLERFTFPAGRDSARVLLDLHIPAEYDYQLKSVKFKKISPYRLEGVVHQFSPGVWSHDADQDYTLHVVVEFDQPMRRLGTWLNGRVRYGADSLVALDAKDAGLFAEFDAGQQPVVQVRTGLSLVSLAGARQNLETELTKPFGWNFEAVRQQQRRTWNELLGRVNITSTNRLEKMRFYNALYRSVCSRNTWSDVGGEWRGTDGAVHRLPRPDDVALGCDAFWNTFWNLNQVWNLVLPEWSNRWVNSQLAMYDAYGWLAKGPAGMNYVPVMVAEHEIPQLVAAYQMGIRDFDAPKVLAAAVKMQTTPAQKVHNGFAGNRDLVAYEQHGYVPADLGRFSNSMEYSFDDWTVGQLARALGRPAEYAKFNARGYWWQHVLDSAGFCHLKNSDGRWVKNFDPFRSGANEEYVEGNAWQLTFFVPQDVPALVQKVGQKAFVDRLDWGFRASEPWRYNGMNDQYWNYPVVQGNQQSMHFAFLFNWAGQPWLTQKWSRSILNRYYGYGMGNAYLGDEDQGQMSAWLVMAALGLFQTDGGTSAAPTYEIGSPLYPQVEIDLGRRYGRGQKFRIEAQGASRRNQYVQSATLNGRALASFNFPAAELLKGGSLVLRMGPMPNKQWGTTAFHQ